MDRRKKRTSTNQYMMYIDMMEKDSIFATGRIPRDVDMNYLQERWKELSDKLNTCTSGPKLTAGEWRKRLNDWKNTTRCKYRRSITSEDITLTALELKALQLFGKAPNVSNSTEELSVHLKSEKYEDDDEMEHQPTSEKFQKELQAAVEEAIGGDEEDEEVMDEPEQANDMVSDPLPITQQNIVVNTINGGGGGGAGMAISSNGASQNNNSHNNNNNSTTTYRTIVVENKYTDGDDSDEVDMIGQRRQHSTSSNTSNVVLKTPGGASVQSNTSTNAPVAASVAKLMNGGDISIKRTRTQPAEHIIYEVSTVKKAPNVMQQPTHQQPTHHQQPQRVVKTIHNNDIQQPHVEICSQPASNSSNITVGNLVASTADCRDIARQLKRLADIKAEKLKFEVARFKFNNPGFVFNLNHI